MQAVITVIGKDQVGILAKVSQYCAEYNVNIVDVDQTIIQDFFTMVMVVNIDKISIDFEDFQKQVKDSLSSLEIHVMHEDIFNSMHRV